MQHVYVHVPFCRRRCSYCDFSIAVRRDVPSRQFADTITAELGLRRTAGEWEDAPLETLYLGGGTPSLLDPAELGRIIALIAGAGDSSRELTLEANPEDVTAERARAWRAAGVNRVSLGVQSFDAAVLTWMHRPHGPDAPPRAMQLLRSAGIRSVSADLIYALPDQLHRDLDADLDHLLSLEPDHISAYGLTVEPRTPLDRWVKRGVTRPADDGRYADEFLRIDARLAREGFAHYEVSNYGRPGQRARHNSAYWTGAPYGGLGPAAHRFRKGQRAWNVSAWAEYADRIAAGQDPTAEREALSSEQQALERLYLGLRTQEGVDLSVLGGGAESLVRNMERQGWLGPSTIGHRLSPTGWLRLDEIVAVLTTSAHGG